MNDLGERILLNMFTQRLHANAAIAINQLVHLSAGEGELAGWLRALADLIDEGLVHEANTFLFTAVFLTDEGVAVAREVWNSQ